MGDYSIYWVKKEFSYRYFHKSDILYRFLQAYQKNRMQIDLNRQFNYITNPFPTSTIITHIKKSKLPQQDIQITDNMIEIYTNKTYISVSIYKRQIDFRCATLNDAENYLFPLLRLFYPFLFIIEHEQNDYGWISPLLKENTHLNGQVLYY